MYALSGDIVRQVFVQKIVFYILLNRIWNATAHFTSYENLEILFIDDLVARTQVSSNI